MRRLSSEGQGRSSIARVELLLFLLVWCAYGATINSSNLEAFNLQQAGVEAIVERRHFYLEGSQHPRLQARPRYEGDRPLGDSFLFDGHKYLSKQPGQVMAGALAYFPLHVLGLSYVENYLLASALVVFFTTSLVTAASVLAVFRVAREITGDESKFFWPLSTALLYGLATTTFPYAGVAHHDALASGYLTIAFYLVFRLARARSAGRAAGVQAACAGLLLGLTLTTSMLPFFMTVVVGLYFVSLRRWRLIPFFLVGGLLGLAPMLFFNAVSFGNPLLMPNVAGNYRDTYLQPGLENFTGKLRFYGSMLTLYVPFFWLGLLGLRFLPQNFRRERRVILALLLVLAAHVLNIAADGACQYGPRYLLPAMPFACLGLTGFSFNSAKTGRLLAGATIALTGLFSFLVNLAGATHGAMYCALDQYGFQLYLAAAERGEWRAYPLAAWLLVPLVAGGVLLALSVLKHRRAEIT